MSANSKFGKLTGRGQPRAPSAKRGVAPSRLGGAIKDTNGLGSGKGAIGGNSSGNGGVTTNSLEECYQLIPSGGGTCPPFAMMIRLTPEILEELKRVEAAGGKSVMQFGANASGHMIKVGHEDLKFSSVSEPGELCDIYEQQQTGEDGQGVLVEAGSVWRKLSVQRTLSASEKDRVKKRSEEAQRKQRSRKAIVLDHSTPPMKNQAAVPAEVASIFGIVNGRRPPMKIIKEPPPKKRKVATSPAAPAPKPRTQFISHPMEGARITSPAPTSPEPSNINFRGQKGYVHPVKGHHVAEEGVSSSSVNKGNLSVQKEKGLISASAARVDGGGLVKAGLSGNNMMELRNFLITLLKENPKGMTIKAVEKAVGEAMPPGNSGRKNIEKLIKSIASYHAPGKYLLNQGVEKGNFLKPSSGSGSSPETAPAESPLSAGSPLQPGRTEMESKPVNKSPMQHGVGGGQAVNVDSRRGSLQGDPANSSSDVTNKEFGRKRIANDGHEITLNADVKEELKHQIPTAMLHDDEQQCSGLKMAQPSDAWLFDSSKCSEGPMSSPKLHAPETKAPDSEGSDGSSSSGSGSETDSDTDSSASGSGSDTGSGSGSGSDSEASSSSSEENMDEDVDIISEDENVNKSDARQRSRVKEVKSLPHKPDGRIQREDLHTVEGRDNKHKLAPDEMRFFSLDSAKSSEDIDIGDATEVGEINKIANDMVEKVFGPDEEVNVAVDADASLCEGYVKSPCKSGSRASAIHDKQDGNESPMSSEGHIKSYEDSTTYFQKSRSKVDHRLNSIFKSKHINGYIETKTERNKKYQGGSVHLAEKVCSEEGKYDTSESRVGIVVSQREEHGSLLVSKSSITDRGVEKKLLGPENQLCSVSKLDLKDQCNDIETNGGLSNKGHFMDFEATMKQTAVSARAKENLQHLDKHGSGDGLLKQKPSVDVRKNSAKDIGPVEKYRKDGQQQDVQGKNNDNLSKGKIQNLQKPGWGHDSSSVPTRNLEKTSKFPEGELTSKSAETMPKNYRAAEQTQMTRKDEDNAVKDKINGVNTSRFTKPEKPLDRYSNDMELQRHQENDAAFLGKPGKGLGSSNRPLKGGEQSSGFDRELVQTDSLNRDHLKVGRPTKQSDELKKSEMIERAGLIVEQAERPLRENESYKRPKTTNFKDTLKEAEPIGRPELDSVNIQADRLVRDNDPYRRPKITNLKDTLKDAELAARPELDGVSSRASLREGTVIFSSDGKKCETDNMQPERLTYTGVGTGSSISHRNSKKNSSELESGEFRKPAVEAEPQELESKPFCYNEDAQSKQNSEAPSKGFFKKENTSFEIVKSQTIRPDMKHSSPVKYGIDAGKFMQDPKGAKRRLDGDEVADSARTYKKLAISQGPKQHFPSNEGKNDVDGLGKPTNTETMSLIAADGQGNTLESSKLFVVESSHKQVDKKGPITDKKKPDTTIPVTIEIKSENPATDHFQRHPKKQTPNSMEVQGADFFAPYENKEAELRGPIKTYAQYKEYYKEYHEKYPIYIRLNTALQSDKEDFESFQRDIDLAKSKDDKSKLDSIYGKVRKDYYQCRKRFKRMQRTFLWLHDDLKDIKQKCKEFAEKQGQG